VVDITAIIEAVIALLVSIATVFLVPWLKEKRLWETAKVGVLAAEQIFKGDGRGPEKLAYVKDWLKTRGYDVDTDRVLNVIEALVYACINAPVSGGGAA
jgi:hypothetical protein